MRAAWLVIALSLARGAAAQEEALPLPSGLVAVLQEVLTAEPGEGLTYRFRFVAEGFRGGGEDLDLLATDLAWLCESYALPRLPAIGPRPNRIVISLADRPSQFGVYDPQVIQVFEAFSPRDGACVWEMF